MKKTYNKPELEITKINLNAAIANVSGMPANTGEEAGDTNVPFAGFWDF